MELRIGDHVQIVNHSEASEADYVIANICTVGATEFAEMKSVDTGKTRFLPTVFLKRDYEWFRKLMIDVAGKPAPEL